MESSSGLEIGRVVELFNGSDVFKKSVVGKRFIFYLIAREHIVYGSGEGDSKFNQLPALSEYFGNMMPSPDAAHKEMDTISYFH